MNVTEMIESFSFTAQVSFLAPILIGVIGFLWCFLGLRWVRAWAALFGLIIGFAGGLGLAYVLGTVGWILLAVGAIIGIAAAIVFGVFSRLGKVVCVLFWGVGSGIVLFHTLGVLGILFGLIVGGMFTLLSLFFPQVVIGFISAVDGAFLVGTSLRQLNIVTGAFAYTFIMVVLAILGIILQFVMESRRRKRQNLEKARKIEEENSTAKEVEKARKVMSDSDEEG